MKKFKVRITQLPVARTGYQVQGALVNDVPAMGGADYNAYIGKKPKQDSRYLTAVSRDEANLEAEGGETAFGDINGDGFPEHKIIKGKRHHEGGVPLNLPDGTFIFSDTKSMKITDCTILKMFNKPCGKQSYTPAELAKPYDINKYRVMLEDPDSDAMTRKTAELMIKKYVIKLGALALAQESKKGFPQGIPEVAEPYMKAVGLTPEDVLPNDPNKQQQEQMSAANDIPQMPNDQEQPVQDQPDGTAPTQMPNGEPIAQPNMGQMPEGMPQGMPPEMMQQAPMAAYGMEMGGFGMPFYNDPYEMAYGGLFRADKGVTVNNIPATRATAAPGEGWNKGTVAGAANNAEGYYKTTAGAERTYEGGPAIGGGSQPSAGWAGSLCDRLMQGATIQQLAKERHGTVAGLTALLKDCIPKAEEKFKEKQEAVYLEPDGTPVVKDETPATVNEDKCQCPDPMDSTKMIDVECPEDGSEPVCGEKAAQGQNAMQMQQGENFWPEWRQQDINNMRNLRNRRHGKEYPIMSNLDMPEMQPVYKNWLGEVQAQLASEAQRSQGVNRAAGNTASKQAVLTQMQSEPERIIGNVGTENVTTENQLDRLTNFNVRDKNMTNRANANQNYNKELGTLNEAWRQEMNAAGDEQTLGLNTGLTNAANTYNNQTEQYAIDPRTGMGVYKSGKAQKPEMSNNTLDTLVKYKTLYPGFDDKVLLAAINRDAGNTGFTPADMMYQAYGGPVFAEGGFVYADVAYPFIF